MRANLQDTSKVLEVGRKDIDHARWAAGVVRSAPSEGLPRSPCRPSRGGIWAAKDGDTCTSTYNTINRKSSDSRRLQPLRQKAPWLEPGDEWRSHVPASCLEWRRGRQHLANCILVARSV